MTVICHVITVADPEGVCLNPLPAVFIYPMKMRIIWFKTKLFHFHGVFKKNENKISKVLDPPLHKML